MVVLLELLPIILIADHPQQVLEVHLVRVLQGIKSLAQVQVKVDSIVNQLNPIQGLALQVPEAQEVAILLQLEVQAVEAVVVPTLLQVEVLVVADLAQEALAAVAQEVLEAALEVAEVQEVVEGVNKPYYKTC